MASLSWLVRVKSEGRMNRFSSSASAPACSIFWA